jgi:predicted site-specific integrase-resolvase
MRLLNARETAERLKVPPGTLRYWRCAGIGPAYVKLGGRVKYDEADVEAYVNANKRKPSVRATLEGKRIGTLSA